MLPILIIASTLSAQPIADNLGRETGLRVELAPSRRSGLAALRRNEYALVLLDEDLAKDAHAAQSIYQKAMATPVLELSIDPHQQPRILRQVQAALTRRSHDRGLAQHAARLTLQNELKSALTGLLLESQLALREAPPSTAAKLRHLVELAGDLRLRLSA
jgi:hypothetical protein